MLPFYHGRRRSRRPRLPAVAEPLVWRGSHRGYVPNASQQLMAYIRRQEYFHSPRFRDRSRRRRSHLPVRATTGATVARRWCGTGRHGCTPRRPGRARLRRPPPGGTLAALCGRRLRLNAAKRRTTAGDRVGPLLSGPASSGGFTTCSAFALETRTTESRPGSPALALSTAPLADGGEAPQPSGVAGRTAAQEKARSGPTSRDRQSRPVGRGWRP